MKRRGFLIGAVGVAVLQSGAVGAMIFNRSRQLSNGREVILESGFIDPRDLFRGHYVRLNLVVGDLKESEVLTDQKFKRRDPVYVELHKVEGLFWTARKLWHDIPSGSDKPFIKGSISRIPGTNNKTYRISFPYDRYFAPKKRAKELEKFRRDQKLGVVLALGGDGSGYIKGITVEGKVIYDEPLY